VEERLTYKLDQLNSALKDFSHSLTIDLSSLDDDVADSDYDLLMDALDDRNKLSHIYNKKQFDEIYIRLRGYSELFF